MPIITGRWRRSAPVLTVSRVLAFVWLPFPFPGRARPRCTRRRIHWQYRKNDNERVRRATGSINLEREGSGYKLTSKRIARAGGIAKSMIEDHCGRGDLQILHDGLSRRV